MNETRSMFSTGPFDPAALWQTNRSCWLRCRTLRSRHANHGGHPTDSSRRACRARLPTDKTGKIHDQPSVPSIVWHSFPPWPDTIHRYLVPGKRCAHVASHSRLAAAPAPGSDRAERRAHRHRCIRDVYPARTRTTARPDPYRFRAASRHHGDMARKSVRVLRHDVPVRGRQQQRRVPWLPALSPSSLPSLRRLHGPAAQRTQARGLRPVREHAVWREASLNVMHSRRTGSRRESFIATRGSR